MVNFVRTTLHQSMREEFGERNIGSYAEMHPIVQRILEECEAKSMPKRKSTQYLENSKYEEFIKSASQSELLARVRDEYKDAAARHTVSPEQFYEHMRSIAIGVQYASKKVGVPVQVDDYEFSLTLKNEKSEKEFTHFDAAALCDNENKHYKLVINPDTIMTSVIQEKPDATVRHQRVSEDEFTPKEKEILLGVEEMLHFYDSQHQNAKPSYTLDEFNVGQYETDASETLANQIMSVAARELGLGKQFRGTRQVT